MLILNKYKIKEFLLYFFILVPYLTMFTHKIDTSAYALLYSILVLMSYKNIKLPRELIYLFLLFIFSLMIAVMGEIDFTTMRALAGYFSIFIISSATYYIFKTNGVVNNQLIYKITILWFIVGLIQMLVDPSFMTSIIVRSTSGVGRGVTGLAPEPTYYGTVAIFLFFISYINNYKIKQTFFMTFIMLLIFSMSATGLLLASIFFILYVLLFTLSMKRFIIFFLAIFIFFSIFISNIDLFSSSRFYFIFKGIFENPVVLFTSDGSGNARMWNILGAFIGAYNNHFLPNGYGTFRNSLLLNLSQFSNYVNPYTLKILGNKIMSGTGEMIFELGFISVVYMYSFFVLSFKAFHNVKKSIFLTFSIFLIMTTAIPLTFPIFGFIYGLLAFKAYRENM